MEIKNIKGKQVNVVENMNNSVINFQTNNQKSNSNKLNIESELIQQKEDFKLLLANNKVDKVILDLMNFFKQIEEIEGLNFVIMQSSALIELTKKEKNNLLTNEQIRIEKAKINDAIISIIDNYVK